MSLNDSQRLMYFMTAPQECAYLPERTTVQRLADPYQPLTTTIYSQLMARGFRRSGCYIYRPDCPGCNACVPARLGVDAFRPDRSQRRNWRLNQDLLWEVHAPYESDELRDLYQRYLAHRHPGGGMDEPGEEGFLHFLTCRWYETRFLELREPGGRLLGVAITDILDNALSAVYTFFEPELPKRGLGTYAVLAQLELTRTMGLEYLYLGYWIRELPKMAYKARFRPLEIRRDGRWQRLDESGSGGDWL